ncbi:MAG: HIT domain-containing protein [bacterium]|nr:HIT domain-containing protein [bacterium]
MSCVFCDILEKKVEAKVVSEREKFIAFRDIHPKAPTHLLLIPRKHIESVNHLKREDAELMGELFLFAKEVALEQGLEGYNLQINVGKKGGQIIDHIHVHLMGSK